MLILVFVSRWTVCCAAVCLLASPAIRANAAPTRDFGRPDRTQPAEANAWQTSIAEASRSLILAASMEDRLPPSGAIVRQAKSAPTRAAAPSGGFDVVQAANTGWRARALLAAGDARGKGSSDCAARNDRVGQAARRPSDSKGKPASTLSPAACRVTHIGQDREAAVYHGRSLHVADSRSLVGPAAWLGFGKSRNRHANPGGEAPVLVRPIGYPGGHDPDFDGHGKPSWPIPEPSSPILFAAGAGFVGLIARRKLA